jgi:hypothetical protein
MEENLIKPLQFHLIVIKSDKYGYDDLKLKTLQNFIHVISSSRTPIEARNLLNIEDNTDIKESFVQETWEDLKHSFDGFWNTKLYKKYVQDNIVTSCYTCNTQFTFYIRKHHCRSCGKIFCFNCSNKKIKVPDDLCSYYSYHFYFNEDRVCDNCFQEINLYNEVKDEIDFLKIGAFDLKILWRTTLLSEKWKKAVIFYFSILRENIFSCDKKILRDYEKNFIINNKLNFVGHSCWLINMLRIDSLIPFLSYKSDIHQPCSFTLCDFGCKKEIKLLEYIKILSGNYSKTCIKFIIIDICNKLNKDDLLFIIPFIMEMCEPELLNLLFDKCSDFNIFNLIYWILLIKTESSKRRRYDLLKNELIMLNTKFSKLFNNINNFLSCLEENYTNIEAIRNSLKNLKLPFPCPFNLEQNIKYIDINMLKRMESASAPIFINYNIEESNKLYCLLFKKEDVRKDLYVLLIIQIFHKILLNENIDIPLILYKIVPISTNTGLIQIVDRSKTLFDVFSNGSLNNYLQQSNDNLVIKDVMNNFMNSFCFWTVCCYLLGIGDRHLENIMVTDKGILFHIDFAYILGKEAKPYAPLVRVDNLMIEALGGSVKIDSFIDICCRIYLILRKYIYLIYPLYLIFTFIDPKIKNLNISEKELDNFIESRFLIGQSDEVARKNMIYVIESSKDTFSQKISDYLHSYKYSSNT